MDSLVMELKNALSDHFAKEGKVVSSSSATTSQQEKGRAKPLVLKRRICYIVCAVVIDNGRVLMMKEAKASCRGLWYLPAGKLEKNETFVEGVKREVLEETGLIFEPTSIVSIDSSTLAWFRVTFTGRITGGKLKTIEQQDKESMEAGWFDTREVLLGQLPLRARDICPLINSTIIWNETRKSDPLFSILPHRKPHSRISFQIILISQVGNGMEVLVNKESVGFLECTPEVSAITVKEAVTFIIKRALTGDKNFKVHGIVRVEHNGGPHGVADGIGLTFLAEITSSSSTQINSSYKWCTVSDENLRTKLEKLSAKGCMETFID